MRWYSSVVLFSSLAVGIVHAQPGSPRAPGTSLPTLSDEAKLRYLVRQLDLDEQQQAHAEGLIAVYGERRQEMILNLQENLENIRAISEEIQAAEKAGDKQRAEELKKQLGGMASTDDAEKEFFQNLESVLNEGQKKALAEARERLKRNPSGVLRPIDVIHAARALGLSSEQAARVDELAASFRKAANPGTNLPFDRNQNNPLLIKLISDVRGVLSEEQGALFDKKIAAMRLEDKKGASRERPEPQPPDARQTPAPRGGG
jgi:hypothetical protein